MLQLKIKHVTPSEAGDKMYEYNWIGYCCGYRADAILSTDRRDGQMDVHTDNVKSIYPTTTS